MLGQWALGEDALGSYPSTEGEYLYAVNLSMVLASTSPVKRGVSFLPVFNLGLAESVTHKVGAKLAVSNGITLAESAGVKAGVKFSASNNVVLALSHTRVAEWVYPESFLNSTLGLAGAVKAGQKLTVVNGVVVAIPTTFKVGVKAPAANAWQLGLSTLRLVGWKPPANVGNIQFGVSAGVGFEYLYEGLAGVEIGADFLYNQAYPLAQLNIVMGLDLGVDVTYRADFWSPNVVTVGDWTKAGAAVNDWTKDSAPAGAWTKEGSTV